MLTAPVLPLSPATEDQVAESCPTSYYEVLASFTTVRAHQPSLRLLFFIFGFPNPEPIFSQMSIFILPATSHKKIGSRCKSRIGLISCSNQCSSFKPLSPSLQPGEAQFNPSVELSGRLGAFSMPPSRLGGKRQNGSETEKRHKRKRHPTRGSSQSPLIRWWEIQLRLGEAWRR